MIAALSEVLLTVCSLKTVKIKAIQVNLEEEGKSRLLVGQNNLLRKFYSNLL